MDIILMRNAVQPHIKAGVATLSNEMLHNLYYDIFPVRKKRKQDGKRELKDIFRGPRHPGKTKRDRKSGATMKRAENRNIRAAWHNRSNLNEPFPSYVCNGKRNRQKVGKPVKEREDA